MPNIKNILKKFNKAKGGRSVDVDYNGITGTGLKGGLSKENAWQMEGYAERYETSVWLDAERFASVEALRQIKIDGVNARILGVRPDSLGALIRIDIGNINARG